MSFHLGRPLFQVPIYAFSEDEHYAWEKRTRAPSVAAALSSGYSDREAEARALATWGHHVWDFNEAAGWLALWANPPDTVKGYLYWTARKQLRHRRSQPWEYEYRDKWLECGVDLGRTAAEITSALCADIRSSCHESPPTRGQYLDLSVVQSLGPALDWQTLMAPIATP